MTLRHCLNFGKIHAVWLNCQYLMQTAKWKKGDYSGYVSKWGIENEITKGHVKSGKNGNSTAWDLLKLSM